MEADWDVEGVGGRRRSEKILSDGKKSINNIFYVRRKKNEKD